MDDNGATFSSSATDAPVQVHGVKDGTSDYDAVNVCQFSSAIASVKAMAKIALAAGFLPLYQAACGVSTATNSSESTTVGIGAGLAESSVLRNAVSVQRDGGRAAVWHRGAPGRQAQGHVGTDP